MKLEEVRPQAVLRGVVPGGVVTVVGVQWYGSEAMEMTYKTAAGAVANELLYRHDEGRIEVVEAGRPWSFDGDRFEGRFRDGVHTVDVSDLMRRMVKERLLKFDATPLFPMRMAYTVPYRLSGAEARLYTRVTDYVRDEFNRAEALENDKRAGTVGFALTILQRRLASSPEAIYQSLRRRRGRLESRLRELELLRRGGTLDVPTSTGPDLDGEEIEDLEDAPEMEDGGAEDEILDRSTAARSIAEFEAEIRTLGELETLALEVRRSGEDTKWRQLAGLLNEVFAVHGLPDRVAESPVPYGAGAIPPPKPSPRQKLVVFTEHRDTLNYLQVRIATVLGRQGSVAVIHGGAGREERLKTQEAFRHDPTVQVLLATDAAAEGINLQRAHLMVNYDLPWNPNRLEQRFGRIHRIGQTEVCHLWNLVADRTREGDVYRTLLDKLEQARQTLGGQVFDVLGKLQFEGRALRDLLLAAIRHGERPDVRAHLTRAVEDAFDRDRLRDLLEERALAQDAMDTSRVHRVREEMERVEARRLQPHYIESFFREAFQRLGGTIRQREPRRYEVSHVPDAIRRRDRALGLAEPVLARYERIVFDKLLAAPQGQPPAAFVCPGHPLLDAVMDLTPGPAFAPAAVVLGGLLVVPRGLMDAMTGRKPAAPETSADTQAVAARARAIVMDVERRLGFDPTDREFEKLGYDIESRVPATGKLRFIEVKGRAQDKAAITVTCNEILYSLNKPDDFILAIVEFLEDGSHRVRYLRHPFRREPDFGVTSVNYDFPELLARAEDPA